MPYTKGLDDTVLDQQVSITLTKRDILLVRHALEEMLSIYTREDHMYGAIHAALARLPNPEKEAAAG